MSTVPLPEPAKQMTKRDRDARRRVLDKGLIACYEIIELIRREQAELDAQERKYLRSEHP